MARLAALVAEELALPRELVRRVRLGGWLHDVGKVAVPDRILDEDPDLEPHEWAIVRTHPEVGEELIRRIPVLAGAARAVRHHHERFDGTGYPDGLRGEAIPLEARIVAAVDTYCAITDDRLFRPSRRTPTRSASSSARPARSSTRGSSRRWCARWSASADASPPACCAASPEAGRRYATPRRRAAAGSDCSLRRLWFSIWRIRSRVTLNARPTSSSVRGLCPSRP